MPKEIRIAFPMAQHPAFSPDSREVINVAEGPDFEALQTFIFDAMPAVKDKAVTTTYHLLYVVREEKSPASALCLRALAEAKCTGVVAEECRLIEGLYEIQITGYVPARAAGWKLIGETGAWYQSIAPLPSVEEMYRERIRERSRVTAA